MEFFEAISQRLQQVIRYFSNKAHSINNEETLRKSKIVIALMFKLDLFKLFYLSLW